MAAEPMFLLIASSNRMLGMRKHRGGLHCMRFEAQLTGDTIIPSQTMSANLAFRSEIPLTSPRNSLVKQSFPYALQNAKTASPNMVAGFASNLLGIFATSQERN